AVEAPAVLNRYHGLGGVHAFREAEVELAHIDAVPTDAVSQDEVARWIKHPDERVATAAILRHGRAMRSERGQRRIGVLRLSDRVARSLSGAPPLLWSPLLDAAINAGLVERPDPCERGLAAWVAQQVEAGPIVRLLAAFPRGRLPRQVLLHTRVLAPEIL